MRIEISNNFSTVDIYKGEQLVSAIDLEGSVNELVKELTGLARTNIVKHEQNKMKPRPHHLEKYAKVYNTTISDILGENECYTIGDYFDEYFRSYSRDLSEEEKKAIARKLVEIYKITQL